MVKKKLMLDSKLIMMHLMLLIELVLYKQYIHNYQIDTRKTKEEFYRGFFSSCFCLCSILEKQQIKTKIIEH
jgi:hypothetical protein